LVQRKLSLAAFFIVRINVRFVIATILVVALHCPAISATICYDSKVAVQIADLSMQLLQGQVNDPDFDTRPYDQRIAALAKKNCVLV
jgi:hypothetical protein